MRKKEWDVADRYEKEGKMRWDRQVVRRKGMRWDNKV
jgi:hypothetical protein